MSTSASVQPQMEPGRTSTPHSRQTSATATPKPTRDTKPSKDGNPTSLNSNPHYVVFVRLPFPRNGFQDPSPVQWDSIKDKALWKLISTASNSRELDWEEMSVRFDVSLPFLLQQAAWLYERHFDAMRAQMKKLNVPSATASGTATPAPDGGVKLDGGPVVGGVGMSRAGSKDSKTPTSANMQRQGSLQRGDRESAPGTPRSNKFNVSRTPSANTVTQMRFLASPRQRNRNVSLTHDTQRTPTLSKEPSQEDDDESEQGVAHHTKFGSEEDTSVIRSQTVRRAQLSPRRTMGTQSPDKDAEDDEEDSSGGDLPFAAPMKFSKEDPAATLRNSPKRRIATPLAASTIKNEPKDQKPQPQDSSGPSKSPVQPKATVNTGIESSNRSGNLSPQHRTELEKLSPRYKESGSEGSPSIGSSFSDLDDTSVSQSALEDALMSNMQYGSIGLGVGSRMSNLRDALKR